MPLATTLTDCQNDGSDFVTYYNVGTAGTPIWVEHLGIIGDLTLSITDDENASTRRNSTSNFKEYLPGRTDVAFTGQQIVEGNYEGNAAFNSAIKDGTPLDLLLLTDDVDTAYAYGLRGQFYNFDRSISAPGEGEMEQSFNFKPAACATTPVHYVKVAVAGTAAVWDPTDVTYVSTS